MTSLHFITKAQFEAVYDHFKQMEEDYDSSREEIQIEYRLLLGYFQSVYEDSERKSNKIMHLTAELKSYKEKSKETAIRKEKDVEELKQKLSEMKESLDHHRKEETILVRLIDELRENIKNLREKNEAKKSKSDIYINRRPTIPPRKSASIREIAVGSSKMLQTSKSILYKKDIKKEESDKSFMPQEIEIMKRKYENEIERLQNQIKVITTEAKLFHSETVGLKKCIDSKDKRFSEDMQRISEERDIERQESESLRIKNSSLQMLVDNMVDDLKIVREEKRLLQGNIKNSTEERQTLLLQIQEKDRYIGNLRNNINSLTKSKESADRQMGVFEENLTMDREQLITAKKDIDVLNQAIEKLRTNLNEQESQLNQQETQRKHLEASQKGELLEQLKLIDYHKAQLAIRDKRIKSLTTDLEQTNEKLAFCRRQLRHKRRENAMLSEEFQKWKKSLGINTENMKSLKMKLDSTESSKSVLQSELKFTKSQYFSVLKERNKFLAQCKQMESTIEYREMENNLINNRQEYLRNNLKMKDEQMQKIAKLRRLTWAK